MGIKPNQTAKQLSSARRFSYRLLFRPSVYALIIKPAIASRILRRSIFDIRITSASVLKRRGGNHPVEPTCLRCHYSIANPFKQRVLGRIFHEPAKPKTSARLSHHRADVSIFKPYWFRNAPIFSASFMPLSYIICSFSWLLLSVDRPQISSGATMSSLPSFWYSLAISTPSLYRR